jgi:glycerate-2-kinase
LGAPRIKIGNRLELLSGCPKRDKLARRIALDLLEHAVRSADPYVAVEGALSVKGSCIRIGKTRIGLRGKLTVVGAGKASGRMAEAVEAVLGDRINNGTVIVPRGTRGKYDLTRIGLLEGDHPQPSEDSVEAAKAVVRAVSGLSEMDCVISLISGGGSSLMCLPSEDIPLEDKIATTRELLRSGATIREFNTVRKHISAVKGGMLAKAAYPANVINLLVSDVPGDREEIIASGPMCPDPSTFDDALRVLKVRGLMGHLPASVEAHISKGVQRQIPETPKPGDDIFRKVITDVVAGGRKALAFMERRSRVNGWRTVVLTSCIEGEARDVGTVLASVGIEVGGKVARRPMVALAAGETTVTVRGDGRGGRNQEVALSAAIKLEGTEGIAVASMGTDGIDGVTDAAGAIVDGGTLNAVLDHGLNPREALNRNNSYAALRPAHSLIFTGPTGTNVSDVMVVVASPKDSRR